VGRLLPPWQGVFSISAVFLVSGAGIPLINLALGAGENIAHGDLLTQIILSCVYIACLALVANRVPAVLRGVRRTPVLWLLVAFALVSVAWSSAPAVTLRRCVALLGTSTLGIYLGTSYSRRGLFDLVRVVSAVCAVLSLVVALSVPSYGLDASSVDGAWQGIFGSKNWLGRMMALSTALWMLHAAGQVRRRYLAWSVIALSLGLVLLSRSVGSFVVMAALLLLIPVLRALRRQFGLAVSFVTLVLLATWGVCVWLLPDVSDLLSWFGRDTTLTGRWPLWELVWEMIQQRPLLGYGYGGFWIGWDGPSAEVWSATYMNGYGWLPPGSHNGVLDLALDLGVVGVILFAATFVVSFRRALVLTRLEITRDALFPCLFLAFVLLSNITESQLVIHNSICWTIYVALSVQLCGVRPARRVVAAHRTV
jgi:O-antigen ligase